MKLKRTGAVLLAVLLVFSQMPRAAADDGGKGQGVYELSDYTGNEALAVSSDGSAMVFSYESQQALASGLKELRGQDDIVWVQPNFSYENTGETVDDPMYARQWAFSNDGTFLMQEEDDQNSDADRPMGPPAGPWQRNGQAGGGPEGRDFAPSSSDSSAVTAVSGIDINAEEAWALYDGGSRDVVVALIDTGVDIGHEDLAGSIWVNGGEIAGNGVDDDGNGYIDDVNGWNFYDGSSTVYTGSEDDHGTHGAGTIAASSGNGVGVAGLDGDTGNVEVMVLKVLGGRDGSGTTEDVIKAIRYAEDNGASIVNLSMGSDTFDYALYLAMKNSGLLFVVAAGNDGADSDRSGIYPAAYDLDNIISVANLQCDGTLNRDSNYGEESVDLAAPGTDILSTTTENTYDYMTGTSMSAPMVTAAAAMVYSYYDGISLSEVKPILLGSVKQLDTLDGLVSTGGMLDAGAALSYDLSRLEKDDVVIETDPGSAPVLTLETDEENGLLYLTAGDADGDLCLVSYGKGELSAGEFDYGSAGTPVTLDETGSAVFMVVSGGTYTFYALDEAGNETTQTITLTATGDSESGSGPGPGGMPDGPHGAPTKTMRK